MYEHDWCEYISLQMHEVRLLHLCGSLSPSTLRTHLQALQVGHNMNLRHSGEGTCSSSSCVYGDQTGIMGFSYNGDDSPLSKFRAIATAGFDTKRSATPIFQCVSTTPKTGSWGGTQIDKPSGT